RSRFFFDRDFRLSTEDALNWGIVHKIVESVDEGFRVSVELVRKLRSIPHNVYLEIKKLMISSLVREVNDRWDELLNTLAEESLKPEVRAKLEEFLRK
ncbi:MAG: enoyl-CoA hydratase/isomerase family protein, partial [Vulcanisaeta sp.]